MKTIKIMLLCGVLSAASLSAEARIDFFGDWIPSPKTAEEAQPAVTGTWTYNLPVLTVRQRLTGKWQGKFSRLPLVVTSTGDPVPLRISFSDDTPNGSGDSIRNSLWMAALTAALQKESPLEGIRISLDFKGGMDGPSAGAVICLGIMSALDGREFPADFAMTGTILPDGTVGLVDGVPEKLRAAAASGHIKRIAIPAFQRFARDEAGEYVDLFGLGRELGLELRPVQSIDEAYRFLHGAPPPANPPVSALDVCRESPAFEIAAMSAFKERDQALAERIAGIATNDFPDLADSWEWTDYICPQTAEQRFEQGALFDAMELLDRADAALSAFMESWSFYRIFHAGFMENNSQQLSDRMDEWPLETQLAFIDGFRAEVETYCETQLGWNVAPDEAEDGDATAATESDESWTGAAPEEGASDLATQSASVLDVARAEGQYWYMCLQTVDRKQLPEMLASGNRSIYEEIDYDRRKLFFLMCEVFRQGKAVDPVVLPVRQAGPEVESVGELFWKAWQNVDRMIETDVLDTAAESADARREDIRTLVIGQDVDYAIYEAAKRYGQLVHLLLLDAEDTGIALSYPSYTHSIQLFVNIDLYAEASARLLELDGETDNAAFLAFVADRARDGALRSMASCRADGIACFGAVSAFQTAERNRAIGGITSGVLADYWKATMTAKALVMAFKNGKGPAEGFNGYGTPAESATPVETAGAEEAARAVFKALLNADFSALWNSFPPAWQEGVSRVTAEIASHVDDETWTVFAKTVGMAGVMLVRKSGWLAEIEPQDGWPLPDDPKLRARILENWGRALVTFYHTATRQKVAAGRLAAILATPKMRLKGYENAGGDCAVPSLHATGRPDGVVTVAARGVGTLDFVQADGHWVPAALVPVLSECDALRNACSELFSMPGVWNPEEVRQFLQTLYRALQTAAMAETPEQFSAAFDALDNSP